MSTHSSDHDGEQPDDQSGQAQHQDPDQEAVGVEIGRTDDEGSTFEPEEDPEGHAG